MLQLSIKRMSAKILVFILPDLLQGKGFKLNSVLRTDSHICQSLILFCRIMLQFNWQPLQNKVNS